MTDQTATAKPRVMREPRKDTLRWRAELAEAEAAFYMAAAEEMVPMRTVRALVFIAVIAGLLIGKVLL